MDEQNVYTVVGYQYGEYQVKDGPHKGEQRTYANLFVVTPMAGDQNEHFSFLGSKAEKYKCSSGSLLKVLKIGDKVNLYFDGDPKYPKVVFINPVK